MGAPISVVATCDWCAPTDTSDVDEPSEVSSGGAAFTPAVPWHDVQVKLTASTMPFTWVTRFTVLWV
jgi:hypothetical protein